MKINIFEREEHTETILEFAKAIAKVQNTTGMSDDDKFKLVMKITDDICDLCHMYNLNPKYLGDIMESVVESVILGTTVYL